ncbi:MAG: TonB-dependent receptor [Granulosicoccus sp.]|nr:TonB-dependent receptor [Granulosicoccus sp.]
MFWLTEFPLSTQSACVGCLSSHPALHLRRIPFGPNRVEPLHYLFAIILSLLPVSALAETLAPIEVLETTQTHVGDVEHSEFTGSYEYISREEITRESGSLAGLIANSAGIQFKQSGGTGSYSAITLRAATAAQTNVYFDGVLLNDASSGGVDLSQLELLNLDSIGIYRGATPIQLGTANIGGAVTLKSRHTGGNSTQVLLGVGSFNEQKFQLARHNKIAGWNTSAAASHVRSDNDFKFRNRNGTQLNPDDDRIEPRANSEFYRSAILLKAGKQISPLQRYDGVLQFSDRNQQLPKWNNQPDIQTSYATDSLQLQLNRRSTASDSERWNHTEGVYFNRSTERYDDRLSNIGLGAQLTDATTQVFGARTYWEAIYESGTLASNLEFRQEKLDHVDLLGVNDNYSATRRGLDAALQFSMFEIDDKLLLTPALRLQTIIDDYDGILRAGERDRSNTELTPQFGISWQHTDNIKLSSNIGQHYREPVFFELFGDRGLYLGNSDLVAEEGINLDLGLQWHSQENPERKLTLTGFASLRDDLIVSVYDARNIGRSVNSGKARIIGVEGSGQWQWNKRWQSSLSVTLQSAENRSPTRSFSGKQLPGEAQFVAFTRLQYQRKSWRAWYEGDLITDRFYDTSNLRRAEDHFIHTLGVDYSKGRLRTQLVLSNLSDDNIEDFDRFPKPGRSIFLSLNYTFDGEQQ